MRSLKTPLSFDLTANDVYGEAVGENYNNNNFKNEVRRLSLTPPEQQDGDVSPLPWTPNGGDPNDLASALIQHKEVLKSSQQVNQLLMESVTELTAAIKVLGKGTMSTNGTVHRKSHNKK